MVLKLLFCLTRTPKSVWKCNKQSLKSKCKSKQNNVISQLILRVIHATQWINWKYAWNLQTIRYLKEGGRDAIQLRMWFVIIMLFVCDDFVWKVTYPMTAKSRQTTPQPQKKNENSILLM